MQPFPYVPTPSEPTMKQVWLAAFYALLTHMTPKDAAEAADEALTVAGDRWSTPTKALGWNWTHNLPIGYRFGLSPLPDFESQSEPGADPSGDPP